MNIKAGFATIAGLVSIALKRLSRLIRPCLWLLLIGYGITLGIDTHIAQRTSSLMYQNVQALPAYTSAIVLGTSPQLADGQANDYFVKRMDAAAKLYHAGKVQRLILSGDAHIGSTTAYNEPLAMQNALIARGVPLHALQQDGAGYRTIDSIRRVKHVYAATPVIIVSQAFHNQRALYLAQALGVQAVALNAPDVSAWMGLRTALRERIARIRLLWDVYGAGAKE